MAIRYKVTRYSFVEPGPISENSYLQLKQKLQNDFEFRLMDSDEKMTNRYGSGIKLLLSSFVSGVILLIFRAIINFDEDINIILDLFLGGLLLWMLIGVLGYVMFGTELTTYAGYLRKKRTYLKKLEDGIRKSTTYKDFFNNFYK